MFDHFKEKYDNSFDIFKEFAVRDESEISSVRDIMYSQAIKDFIGKDPDEKAKDNQEKDAIVIRIEDERKNLKSENNNRRKLQPLAGLGRKGYSVSNAQHSIEKDTIPEEKESDIIKDNS